MNYILLVREHSGKIFKSACYTEELKFNVEKVGDKIKECNEMQEMFIDNICKLNKSVQKITMSAIEQESIRKNVDWQYDEMEDISDYVNKLNGRVNDMDADLSWVEKNIQNTNERVNDVNTDLSRAERNIEDMNGRVNDINKGLTRAEKNIQQTNQYSRINSALLHGLKDVPKNCSEAEFIQYICNKLNDLFPIGVAITPYYIDTAHVLATKRKNRRSSVVIVKFTYRWVKNKIMECFLNRRFTTNHGVTVTEQLIEQRMPLLKEAEKVLGRVNDWSEQGVLMGFVKGRCVKIKSMDYLHSISRYHDSHKHN